MRKFSVFFFLLFTSMLFSQENNENKDVKVGLVLSGGGAKGFAHISVLKALEEAGVRIDYIGGTSMGAIIGALYASGYSANELDSIVRVIDYDKIMSNRLPRKSKPFYEKTDGEKYALVLPIKNRNIGFPKAISEGQNILNLYTQLTQHVNNIKDFSKLPIPFLCIGTNLETGEQEILTNGFLPQAMAASGAIPTLLAPVEYNGNLLADGGIVNNFPVEEVKAMGADVIIGVDLQRGLKSKDELDSALKILNQIIGFQIKKSLKEKRKQVDFLVLPNLKDYGVVSFDKIDEIMKQGDSAAYSKMNQFKALAKLQTKKKPKNKYTSHFKKFHISKIEITGNKHYTNAYILGKLNLKTNDIISYFRLTESINNLTATGNFEIIQYEIDESSGLNVLKLKIEESDIVNYLKLGIHYDDLYKTGVLINITSKHLLFKNDIFSADLVLGDNIRYTVNYFIDNGFYWSFGLKFSYNHFTKNIKFNDIAVNKIDLNFKEFRNQAFAQTVFSRKFAIGVGVEYQRIVASTQTVSEIEELTAEDNGKLYFDKSDYFNLFAYLKFDTYNKSFFPKEGVFLDLGILNYVVSSDYNNDFTPFSQGKANFGFATSFFSEKVTFQFISEAGITIGDNNNKATNFNVGGYGENFVNNFIPFFGYDLAELNNDSFLKSGITFRYEFARKNYFSLAGNYARVADNIFNEGRMFEDTKSGYMVGYGLETFLGPIEVHYSWSPDHKNNYWYFNVGFWF